MGATDCICGLVRMKEAATANNSAEQRHYLYVSEDSGNWGHIAKGLKASSRFPAHLESGARPTITTT